MRKLSKHISCLIGILLSVIMMQGQELPSLGTAKEITRGSLPDGIQFFLVTNPGQKGVADFALVQRGRRDAAQIRGLLRELPHFGRRAPYRFLADHGIGYGQDGYISLPADAALFSFHDVPTYDERVADSTLLMLFDMAAAYRKPQAIIISGDIDAARIRERMDLLSMMVPPLEYNFPGTGYLWEPRDTLALRISASGADEVAAVNAIFCTARLDKAEMNTPLPLITQAYADQLGRILGRRMERSFRDAGIPLAGFRYRYFDSARGPGDERHMLTAYVPAAQLDSATRRFAAVLGTLDREGAGLAEFLQARERQIADTRRDGARRLRNDEYLDRCVAAYLYGSNLASGEMLGSFIGTHRLDDGRELALFNSFARALLDSTRNLTLRFDLPAPRQENASLRQAFAEGWGRTDSTRLDLPAAPAATPAPKRVRLSGDASEPLSGGRLWTFSNGIKVIYKKMNTPREFNYALLLRGGVAGVPQLQAGESAFVGDMLGLSRIAGLSGDDFRERLDAAGISLQVTATLSDLRLTGRAPSAQLPLLLQTLVSVADARQPDSTAFAAYRAAEALRVDREALSPRDVDFLMDTMLRPDYFYPERKRMASLQAGLPDRAERYFASLFDKVGDGILVLMGDLDEDTAKKELCRMLGGFRTKRLFSSRPRVDSRFVTGTVTRRDPAAPGAVGGREVGVNVALSAAVPFNLDSYMSFRVACAMLRRQLAGALAERGARVDVSTRLELFPAERLTLYIHCHPCQEDGLPAGIVPGEPDDLLEAIRTVTRHLDALPLPENVLNATREALVQELEQRYADPQTLTEDVLVRYSEGKDLITGYKAAVRRVSVASVRDILGKLAAGAEIEYLIDGK